MDFETSRAGEMGFEGSALLEGEYSRCGGEEVSLCAGEGGGVESGGGVGEIEEGVAG